MSAFFLTAFLVLQLSPVGQTQLGGVTGQLLDNSGRPVASTRIAAAELIRPGNTREANALAVITETDAAGRFRLENIPPGRYYILAGFIDYPTYYPGVIAAADAIVVEIAAGKIVENLTFSLARPQGVTVTGRLAGPANSAPVPIALFSVVSSVLQTESRKDGSFVFSNVPQGSYSLRAPGFIPVNVSVDGEQLNVELTPLYSGPGVRVSGRAIGKSATLQPGVTRTVTLTPLFPVANIQPGGNTLGGLSNGVLETSIRVDGSFEFPSVPSGIYTLRSIPRAPNSGDLRVEVDGKDIRGLEIGIPFRIDVAGRVLLNGQSFIGDAIVEANQENFGTAASIRPDGTFRLPLTEGNNRISVGRLPPEFRVVSITWGSTDILNTALRIDPDTAPREIVINLEKNARTGPGNPQAPERALPQVVVSGKVSVVDAQGRKYPIMPANLTVAFKRPSGGVGGSTIAPDGSFGMPLPEELYIVSVTNVTAPFAVKSISSGGTDLLKQPLEVTSRRTVPPIEIILEYRP